MSQYFQTGERVLWNPSNTPAQLFIRTAEAMVPIAELPTGIESRIADEYDIDMTAFEAFVNTLVHRYQATTHLILRSLLEGFLATALVLVDRGGGRIPALDDQPTPHLEDVSVSRDGIAPQGSTARLAALAAVHARAMPR
ncbi:hypothetical protein GCM10027290_05170 [Micromonospora sonneratiae]|uniref:DUF6086 family protein n=1 Tax=Micromonospora sonneratiae TaxID=1184706 RepID=A0ABW3YNX2_9ACTN